MKFSFGLKGKRAGERKYRSMRSGRPDTAADTQSAARSDIRFDPQWDLYTALLLGGTRPSLRQHIRDNDPAFVARLAIHLYEKLDLRSLSFRLSAELSISGADEGTAILLQRLLHQPAGVPEWLGYYFLACGRPNQRPGGETMPARTARPGRATRRVLESVINRLDEFQFARYDKDSQTRIKDAIRFLRPKAADKTRKTLFSKILKEELPVRSTWEQEWQAMHRHQYKSPEQRQVALRDKWKEGISSFRIGYTALLDNLQPMLCAGVSGKVLKLAAEYLGNAVAVGKSGTSTLRLLEVYRSLRKLEQGGTGMLSEALEQATLHSAWHRSDLEKNMTWVIAMDVSNSMKHPVGGYSGVQRFDIGPLLAMILKSRGEQVTAGIIGNTWKTVDLLPGPILGGADRFRERDGAAGYAINAQLILQDLLRKKQIVDKVLIFTDCRLWDYRPFHQAAGTDLAGAWKAYRQIAPKATLVLFDLAGYSSAPLEERPEGVFLVAGWHERIFDVLQALGNGKEILETIAN